MRTTPFALLAAVVLALSLACGGSAPPPEPEPEPEAANPNDQFAGAWTLVRSERRDADGELIGEPREDRDGYIMYDPSGYMGVAIMSRDREPYSEGGPTPEEALAQMGSYASYFGRFSVNEEEGYVTHHLEGGLNPSGAGSDYRRYYTIEGDTLRLQPPASEDGARSYITWRRLPDLEEAELTDTHRRLFGVYRVESVTRQTTDGEPIEVDQYETAYIMYAPSGNMSVHL
ncbi:MAG: lipocalin-like domain-containing protein, partial [Acidobacteria bacterium]|nr:lipocalin-like domain-containing protein [Acidobacteriota bacterium]